MRYLLCLLCIAAAANASGTLTGHTGGTGGGCLLPETDDILDSYAYNYDEVMSTIGASFDDYACIDDLTLGYDADCMLGSYACWGVTTGSTPAELELMYVGDASGMPDGAPISQISFPVENINSGYTFGGYTVWYTVLNLTSGPVVQTPCWLGSHRADGVNWYPLGGFTVKDSEGYRTTAAGWAWQPFSQSLEPGDLFKIIDAAMALERNSWAGVKSSFEGGN